MMLSEVGLAEEERVVDPQLGYPHGYAKLCRYNVSGSADGGKMLLRLPFSEGPPQRFLPYPPQVERYGKLKEWDSLFPALVEVDREPLNVSKFREELWRQLDHLGNAGFDPAKFRVDPYGNVVYWNADPASPLAWEIDHWFPHPRGGRTVMPNLRVVQWQAYQRKRNRLEFLVPWWDLQHGCSINQFLSAFAAKNADFRKRSFALFFAGGEDETVAIEHVGECRPWPQHFREKKAQCGLAAAAIVSVPKDSLHKQSFRSSDRFKAPCSVSDSTAAVSGSSEITTEAEWRHWTVEEEEALRRAIKKFGPGCWKEIKESESILASLSTSQIKHKFRTMRGKRHNSVKDPSVPGAPTSSGRNEYMDRQFAATTALQKELRVKIRREELRRDKEEEIVDLKETVMKLRQQNEKERLKALELEAILTKHKQRVEKQRRWAETQSSYRLCLERMIRDTMHQSISYKEQAHLNQAACQVLMARLDSQKATCEAAEKDLFQRYSQREILEAAVGDDDVMDNLSVMQKKLGKLEQRGGINIGGNHNGGAGGFSSCASPAGLTDEEDEDEEQEQEQEIEEEDDNIIAEEARVAAAAAAAAANFHPGDHHDLSDSNNSDDIDAAEYVVQEHYPNLRTRAGRRRQQQQQQQTTKELLHDHELRQQQVARKSLDKQSFQVSSPLRDGVAANASPLRVSSPLRVGSPLRVSSPLRARDEIAANASPLRVRDEIAANASPLRMPMSPLRSKALVTVAEAVKRSKQSGGKSRLRRNSDADLRSPDSADDEMDHELPETEDTCSDNNSGTTGTVERNSAGKELETQRVKKSDDTRSTGTVEQDITHTFGFAQHPVSNDVDLPESAGQPRPINSKQEIQKNIIMVRKKSLKADYHVPADIINNAVSCRQEYLEECLQHIRSQIPTMEAGAEPMQDDLVQGKPEENLDELLHQVLTTHLHDIQRKDGRLQQSDIDDERTRKIGKLNLDKWLEVLLFKNGESTSSSPDQPDVALNRVFSPALSQISMAAMRGSMELQGGGRDQAFVNEAGENVERPKGLLGGLLRKLSSVRHPSEQSPSRKFDHDPSSINETEDEHLKRSSSRSHHEDEHHLKRSSSRSHHEDEHHLKRSSSRSHHEDEYLKRSSSRSHHEDEYLKRSSSRSHHEGDIATLLDSMNRASLNELAGGRQRSTIPESVRNWPGFIVQQAGIDTLRPQEEWGAPDEEIVSASDATEIWKGTTGGGDEGVGGSPGHHYMTMLDRQLSMSAARRAHLPRRLSDVDEISETESSSSANNASSRSHQSSQLDTKLDKSNSSSSLRRGSIKAASLAWRKAVKRLESRVQENAGSPPPAATQLD